MKKLILLLPLVALASCAPSDNEIIKLVEGLTGAKDVKITGVDKVHCTDVFYTYRVRWEGKIVNDKITGSACQRDIASPQIIIDKESFE